MDFLFDMMFVVLKHGWSVLSDAFIYCVSAIIVFVALAVSVFIWYLPLNLIMKRVPDKDQNTNLAIAKRVIVGKSEKILTALLIVSGVLCLPIFFMGASKTMVMFDEKVKVSSNHEVETSTEVRQFKLLSLSNPKHVYASFEDVLTGTVYSQMYVGTYCPGKARLLGETYNIKVTYFHMSDDSSKGFVKFGNLSKVFCE